MTASHTVSDSPARRLLVISYGHPPSPGVGGTRWLSMARHLRELGHSVTIVASDAWGALPDDADLDVVRVRDPKSASTLRTLLRRGKLRQEGDRDLLERPPGRLLTGLLVPEMNVATWLPQAAFAVRRLLAHRAYDCVITSSPPESSHLIGLLLGRERPAWVADFRDGWTFEAYRPRFPTGVQRRLDRYLERRVVRSAEAAVGVTQPIADDLSRRFGAFAVHVSNGWDPDSVGHPAQAAVRSGDGTVRLVYTGTLSGGWGRDPAAFLHALRAVSAETKEPQLRLIHAGRLRTEEKALIDRAGVAGLVEHLGILDRAGALALQRSADALMLLTSRNSSEATGKVFEYLFSGRPIVALAENSEAARIVSETNTGITVPPDDVEAIAAALRTVVSGELLREYAPRNLDQYEYPRLAEQMAELIEEAIRRRRQERGTPHPGAD
jgi:glycosyltransferase involved in cell wall biosynthesis